MTGLRRAMSPADDYQALEALITWFAENPDCTDPAAGVKALGLPDVDSIPADVHARTQRRMAAEAAAMLQHAGFAIRNRDARRLDGQP